MLRGDPHHRAPYRSCNLVILESTSPVGTTERVRDIPGGAPELSSTVEGLRQQPCICRPPP
jgi:hypothetical protein